MTVEIGMVDAGVTMNPGLMTIHGVIDVMGKMGRYIIKKMKLIKPEKKECLCLAHIFTESANKVF